jgi:hypothetical protein
MIHHAYYDVVHKNLHILITITACVSRGGKSIITIKAIRSYYKNYYNRKENDDYNSIKNRIDH